MTKINYYQMQCETIKNISNLKNKPKLLIHVCCAVCASYPISYLENYFDITIYFNNSNIYPDTEYYRRLDELKKYLGLNNSNAKLIVTQYDNQAYNNGLKPLADEKEGGKRCWYCYGKRMNEGYKFASENKYDYYCTIMSISRQKDSQKINEIGKKISNLYPNTKYFYSDFKKNGGILKANEILKEFNLYKQNYCGCIYSYQDMLNRLK